MYAQSLQKRVEKQKEQTNRNLASWFIGKFSKKTQYLRDQDEESVQAERMRRHAPTSSTTSSGGGSNRSSRSGSQTKPGRISAVTAATTPKPQQRQRSFLRAQLLEMKRESAETLLSAQQKRMAGEAVDEVVRLGTQLGIDNSDDEDYALDESDDDLESVRSVDEIDDALVELTPAEFRAIRKEKWLLKKSRALEASAAAAAEHAAATPRSERAHSSEQPPQRRSSHGRRRSSADSDADKENDGAAAAELNVRLSRATQMYAEALSQIDHALRPSDQPPEPRPLLLGAKKAPKSEWI